MQNIKLSIILLCYEKKEADFFLVLSLLNGQLGVDFAEIEVVIVKGKTDAKEEFTHLFPSLNLRSVEAKKNLSATKQAGLDAAAGEYIMFLAENTYPASVLVLNAFLAESKKGRPQLILSPWLEERWDEGENIYSYIQHDNDGVNLQGKAFNRAFLLQKKIGFPEHLKKYASNYFISLALLEAQDIRRLMTPACVCNREGSSGANDLPGIFLPDYIQSMECVLEETQKRYPGQMHSSVCQSILEVYFLLNRRVWQLEENKGFLKIGESAFGGMIKQYLPYYETTPGDIFAAMYNTARHRFFRGEIEKERFAVWFSRVTRSPDEGAG